MPLAGTLTVTFIKAPPDEVFAYVSDLSRHGEWAADDLKVEAVSGGDVAVGKEYRSVAQLKGKAVNGEIRVTEYTPPYRFAFVVKDDLGEHTHELNFSGERAGTELDHRVISKLPLWGYVMFKIIGWPRTGRPARQAAYSNLKSKVEPEVQGYLRH